MITSGAGRRSRAKWTSLRQYPCLLRLAASNADVPNSTLQIRLAISYFWGGGNSPAAHFKLLTRLVPSDLGASSRAARNCARSEHAVGLTSCPGYPDPFISTCTPGRRPKMLHVRGKPSSAHPHASESALIARQCAFETVWSLENITAPCQRGANPSLCSRNTWSISVEGSYLVRLRGADEILGQSTPLSELDVRDGVQQGGSSEMRPGILHASGAPNGPMESALVVEGENPIFVHVLQGCLGLTARV
jgi:hypothetical protein